MESTDVEIVWFKATDIPKRDNTPFKTLLDKKTPLIWQPFSKYDSDLLEQAFQNKTERILPVELDGLFEVDLTLFEISPIYWDGPIYEVRRGIWFEPKGNAYIPCPENLSNQLEDGYKKYKGSNSSLEKIDSRWALFGPYIGQYVLYQSESVAFIQTDELTSKLTRVVLMTSGTKIIRGWREADIAKNKQKKAVSTKDLSKDVSKDTTVKEEEVPAVVEPVVAEPIPTPREINHLILAIHGIGQKLSEKVEAMSFTYDCDVLRNGLKDAANNMITQFQATNHHQKDVIPKDGGVQVLPIQWRQKVNLSVPHCESSSDEDDEDLAVGDILPEGIPGIRMLVSDVILDVLLYMTPKYRQEMINHVSAEINRVYALYKKRNPEFKGTVSLYGHSLGSVISWDIVTHQQPNDLTLKRSQSSRSGRSTEVDISDLLAGNIDESKVEGLMEQSATIRSEKLLFDTDHLFTVGSPIGMFLLLGGYAIRPPEDRDESHSHNENAARPSVKSLYNIFHPYDPVAHRLEPLFSHRMSTLKPIPVHYSKGGITQTVKGIEAARSEMVERGRSLLSGLVTSAGSMLTKISGSQPNSETDLNTLELANVTKELGSTNLTAKSPERRRSSITSNPKSPERKPTNANRRKPSSRSEPTPAQQSVILKMKALNDHGRLDFALQESLLENPYLSSLGSHMNYWSDTDANSLIVRSLYHIQLSSNSTMA